MYLAAWFISGFFLLTFISLGYYFYVEKPKLKEKQNSKVIQLQTDGFDYILYKGKISEMVSDYHKFLGNMDVVVYSKSLFIGFLSPKQTYLEIPAKGIESIKYEPNKVTVQCYKELSGTKKVIIKGKSTKQLYMLSKKIDFIIRRSKKASSVI